MSLILPIVKECRLCPHFTTNIAKCEFFIKRCSTVKLWEGKLPPPEQCPNREKLIELGAMDTEI